MRFEVPQFIEIEDKIFGPFTWRQFLYLGGGLGMAVVMFFTLPFVLFAIFGIPLALLSAALAFYPVNSRPFSYFLEAIFNYVRGQRMYFWRKKSDVVHKARPEVAADSAYRSVQPTGPGAVAVPRKRNITSLARKLELKALQKTE